MIPADYFDRLDTPAENSPVGRLMRKMRAAFPNLDLETIREESRAALYGVGGKNRVAIAFNRFLRNRKVDKAPRKARARLIPQALEMASGLSTSIANQRSV
jgi:DNA invertase Pin-like site-specific DNA recombinase